MVLLRYAKALLGCLILCSMLPVFATAQENRICLIGEDELGVTHG